MLSLFRLLAAALALALLGPGPAGASDAAREPAPQRPEEADRKDRPADGKEEGWIDVGHAFIEQRVFAPILRFDRFFSDERDLDAERARSFLRWRSEVRFSEDFDGLRPAFTTGVRATLRLPGLNRQLRRIRVVIAGETRDAIDALFPERGRTTTERTATEEDELGNADAGIRFYFWDTLLSHADLGGGVLMKLPPGVYGRLRFRWAVPLGRSFLSRTAVTGFWRTDTRFGTSVSAEVERPLPRALLGRISGFATLTEVSHGVEWAAELAALASLGRRAVAQVGAAVNGFTEPPRVFNSATGLWRRAPDIDRYRIYTRLRRDIYRRWLFVELEPEMAWPWTAERGRHPAWGLAFRFEVQFQGNEAPPPPPPPEPPEPRDPPAPDEPPVNRPGP